MGVALPVSEHLSVGQELLQDVVAKDERQGAERPIEPEIEDVPADRVAAMDPRCVQRDEPVAEGPELLVAPVFQAARRLDVVLKEGVAIGVRLCHVELRQRRAELPDVAKARAVNGDRQTGGLIRDPGAGLGEHVDVREAGGSKTGERPPNRRLGPRRRDQPHRPRESARPASRWACPARMLGRDPGA